MRNKSVVIALGEFDGVHTGHRALLETAKRQAARLGAQPAAHTFINHPSEVLGSPVPLLTTAAEKRELLESCGILPLMQEFTLELAHLTGREFIQRLCAEQDVKCMVAGYDYRFGRYAACDVHELSGLGMELGFDVCEVAQVDFMGQAVSSTRIRAAIAEGRLDIARRMLSYDYFFTGSVFKNRHIGSRIGCPTVNIRPGAKQLPPCGVYISRLNFGDMSLPGITNIGTRPTVNGEGIMIETHILDFNEQLYGATVRVSPLEFVRPEKDFGSLEALKAQINADIAQARAYFEREEA